MLAPCSVHAVTAVTDRRDELDGDEEERREYERNAVDAAQRGIFVLSWEEHQLRKARARREIAEARRIELDNEEREARMASPEPESSHEPAPDERGPYLHRLLEEAVKLREQGASHDAIHEEWPELSKRQARYIADAVDAGKLWSTPSGLEGVIRTDSLGAYIPEGLTGSRVALCARRYTGTGRSGLLAVPVYRLDADRHHDGRAG
jgi:hypothetical protein